MQSQLAELQGKYEGDRTAWQTERAAWSAGITDDEGVDVARTLYNRLPKTDRPAFGDWLTSLKSDPSKAPRSLQPYLGAPPSVEPAQGRGLPRSNAGTVAQPTGPAFDSGVSLDALRAARAELAKGNEAPYRALRPALGVSS